MSAPNLPGCGLGGIGGIPGADCWPGSGGPLPRGGGPLLIGGGPLLIGGGPPPAIGGGPPLPIGGGPWFRGVAPYPEL